MNKDEFFEDIFKALDYSVKNFPKVGFVIFIDKNTEKFVQFLIFSEKIVILDLAYEWLEIDGQERARQFISQFDCDTRELVPVTDSQGESLNDLWQVSFNNFEKAALATIDAFCDVHLLEIDSIELQIDYGA